MCGFLFTSSSSTHIQVMNHPLLGLMQSHQTVFSISLLPYFILFSHCCLVDLVKMQILTIPTVPFKSFNDFPTALRVKTKIFTKVSHKVLCTPKIRGCTLLLPLFPLFLDLCALVTRFLVSPMCSAPFIHGTFVKKSPFARNTSSPFVWLIITHTLSQKHNFLKKSYLDEGYSYHILSKHLFFST